MRRACAVLLLLLAGRPAPAAPPPTPAQAIALEAPDAAALRARLAAIADSTPATTAEQRMSAGEASALLARLAIRAGRWDEAVERARAAATQLGLPEDHLRVADVLIARQQGDDLAQAVRHLDSPAARQSSESMRHELAVAARSAWARFLTGDSTGSAGLLARAQALADTGAWSLRLARMAAAAGQPALAYELLMPLAVATRGESPAILAPLERAAAGDGGARRVGNVLAQHLTDADSAAARTARALGGRRVRFRAADGEALGGIVVATRARRPAAVVLVPAGDSVAWYDSLSAQLVRSGRQVLLLDPRGVRESALASPGPRDAFGAEDLRDSLLAADVSAAVRALALSAPTDTARVLVVGVEETSWSAALAARSDRRVDGVMLLSPWPEPCLRGLLAATLAAAGRPVFIQIGPEGLWTNPYAQRLADRLPPRLVRVADSGARGRGARLFRAGPEVGRRFSEWWAWAAPKPAPPRRARR